MVKKVEDDLIKRAKQLLEEHGLKRLKVLRDRKYVSKQVRVDNDAWKDFKRCADQRSVKTQEALTQAIELWTDVHAKK